MKSNSGVKCELVEIYFVGIENGMVDRLFLSVVLDRH